MTGQEASIDGHDPRPEDAGQGDDGGHREVDASGDENEGLAHRHREEGQETREDVAEVRGRGETGNDGGENGHESQAEDRDPMPGQELEDSVSAHAPPSAACWATWAPHIRSSTSSRFPEWITKPSSRMRAGTSRPAFMSARAFTAASDSK